MREIFTPFTILLSFISTVSDKIALRFRRCANEQELRVHKKCHVNNTEEMKCCVCNKEAPGTKPWYALMRHILSKHPGVVPPRVECGICSK